MSKYDYEYTTNKINTFIELFEYLKENESKIAPKTNIRQSTCPVHVSKLGSTVVYYYNASGFLQFLPEYDNSYSAGTYMGSNGHFDFGIPHEIPDMKFTFLTDDEEEELDVLSPEELTEEMFEQLRFLHSDAKIYCIFLISKFYSLGKRFVYDQNIVCPEPEEILDELKRHLGYSQTLSQSLWEDYKCHRSVKK